MAEIPCTWQAAGGLKEAAVVFIVAGSLSLTTLPTLTHREHMAPQAQAGGERPLEGQYLQALSLPSAGACGKGATAGGAPRLPALPQPRPGPQAARHPEGSPLGTAWYPSTGLSQVIHFLEC